MKADREIEREERAIYGVLIGAALPVIVGVIVDGGYVGGGATISIAALVLGIAGLFARRTVREKLPRAIARFLR